MESFRILVFLSLLAIVCLGEAQSEHPESSTNTDYSKTIVGSLSNEETCFIRCEVEDPEDPCVIACKEKLIRQEKIVGIAIGATCGGLICGICLITYFCIACQNKDGR